MSDNRIYILTGPVQTGKTTNLIEWSSHQSNVFGVLTPVVNGKRVFQDAHTHEQFPMEATEREEETLLVGRFTFSKAGFDKAMHLIRNSISNEGWLIIDEIGPLELRGEGFAEVLKEVLAQRQHKILLVIREGLIEKINEYFDMTRIITVTKTSDLHEALL